MNRNKDGNIMVLDIEGTDSKERGEQRLVSSGILFLENYFDFFRLLSKLRHFLLLQWQMYCWLICGLPTLEGMEHPTMACWRSSLSQILSYSINQHRKSFSLSSETTTIGLKKRQSKECLTPTSKTSGARFTSPKSTQIPNQRTFSNLSSAWCPIKCFSLTISNRSVKS